MEKLLKILNECEKRNLLDIMKNLGGEGMSYNPTSGNIEIKFMKLKFLREFMNRVNNRQIYSQKFIYNIFNNELTLMYWMFPNPSDSILQRSVEVFDITEDQKNELHEFICEVFSKEMLKQIREEVINELAQKKFNEILSL